METVGVVRLETLPSHPAAAIVAHPTVVVGTAVVDHVVAAAEAVAAHSTRIIVARVAITRHTRLTTAPAPARTTLTALHAQTPRAVLRTSTARDTGKACRAQLDVT